jgi:hypothetical protein
MYNAKTPEDILKQFKVAPNTKTGISLDVIDADIIEIVSVTGWKIKEDFQALISIKNQQFKTYAISSKVLILRKFTNSAHPSISITIQVGLIFKNIIPLPLTLQATIGNEKIEKIIQPNTEIIIDEFQDLQGCLINFKLPNSDWTQDKLTLLDLYKILQDDKSSGYSNKITKSLSITDQKGFPYILKITCLKNNPNKLFIHTDSLLLNKTGIEGIECYQEANVQNKPIRFSLEVSQKIQIKEGSQKEYPTSLLNLAYPVFINTHKTHKDTTEKLKLSTDCQSQLITYEYPDDDNLVTMPINIVSEVHVLGKNIYIDLNLLETEANIESDVYTIYPGYSFCNKTEFILIVQTSSKTSMVNSNEVISLDWYKDTEKYPKIPIFTL